MNLIFFAVFASVAVQILQNRSIYLRESSTKKGLRKSRKPLSLLTKSTLYLFGSAFVAEMVGFEPTCPVKDNTISNRARYDRFDTSPYIFPKARFNKHLILYYKETKKSTPKNKFLTKICFYRHAAKYTVIKAASDPAKPYVSADYISNICRRTAYRRAYSAQCGICGVFPIRGFSALP